MPPGIPGPKAQVRDPAVAEQLGFIKGQLRELTHGNANREMVQQAIAESLSRLDRVPAQLDDIMQRLTLLETDKLRRDERNSVFVMILKSPIVGWVVAGVVAVVVAIKAGVTLRN